MSVQQMSVNQISNPADRDKLLNVLRECSGSLTRIDGEKDYIKESVNDICKTLQLPKRLVNRMVKVYHKQNYDEEVATHEQFETLYETIVK
jgi:hypothetical protein